MRARFFVIISSFLPLYTSVLKPCCPARGRVYVIFERRPKFGSILRIIRSNEFAYYIHRAVKVKRRGFRKYRTRSVTVGYVGVGLTSRVLFFLVIRPARSVYERFVGKVCVSRTVRGVYELRQAFVGIVILNKFLYLLIITHIILHHMFEPILLPFHRLLLLTFLI